MLYILCLFDERARRLRPDEGTARTLLSSLHPASVTQVYALRPYASWQRPVYWQKGPLHLDRVGKDTITCIEKTLNVSVRPTRQNDLEPGHQSDISRNMERSCLRVSVPHLSIVSSMITSGPVEGLSGTCGNVRLMRPSNWRMIATVPRSGFFSNPAAIAFPKRWCSQARPKAMRGITSSGS